jgi:hypothetical protein
LWVRYPFIIGFAVPIAVKHLSVTAVSVAWVFAKWNSLVDEVVGVTKNDCGHKRKSVATSLKSH